MVIARLGQESLSLAVDTGLKWLMATGVAAVLGMGLAGPPAVAQSDSLERGQALAQRDCAMCHAIDANDESIHPHAPAFRDLRVKLSSEILSQLVAGGMLSGHPHMPAFRLTDEEYGDLARYLNQLQNWNRPETGR